MTEGALFVAGGIALAVSAVEQVVDYIQTVKALGKGYKEVGPIASKVVAKWGVNGLPVYTFIRAFATIVVGGSVFGTIGGDALLGWGLGLAIAGAIVLVKNAKA